MTELGQWANFIDEAEMHSLYNLPERLADECAHYQPDGRELEALSDVTYSAVHAAAVAYANASVAAIAPPHHGPRHFELTELRGMAALAKLEELTGQTFPTAVKQAKAIALRLHDCHHCGSAFRATAPKPELLWRPELGTDVSLEWVSAIAVDEFGRRHNAPLPWRLFQTMVVWDSTFGAETELGQKLGLPSPKPTHLWGRLMRAADVCPAAQFDEWLRTGIAVTYGELPAAPAPTSWEGFVAMQTGFAGYVEECFDLLDAVAGVPLTTALGWRDRIISHRTAMTDLVGHPDTPLTHFIESELSRYGVALS